MLAGMNDADRALLRVAAGQRQVFTRRQAVEAGLARSTVSDRVRAGRFVPCGPHTLHHAGVALDWRGRLQAGLLDLGPGALVSGRAAAALHGLDGFEEGWLEYLVGRRHRGRTTAGVVRSCTSGRVDVVTVDGLATASATGTILTLLGRVGERELGNAIDSAVRTGLTAPTYLRRRLDELGRQGRVGVAAFDRVMESAGVQSWLERQFLALIRGHHLPVPAVQRIYRRDGIHVARVDFDFAPLPIVVEVGGRRGYLSAEERRRHEHRRNELQLLGRTVYFFTTEDVVDDGGRYVLRTRTEPLRWAA